MTIYGSKLKLGVCPVNEDQARIMRISQYLLSKDVQVKQEVIDKCWMCRKVNITSAEIIEYLVAYIKAEFWEEIAGEIWILIK